MNLIQAHKFFNDTFKMPMNRFINGWMTIATGQAVIDIFIFDGWLHEQFGNYEDENMSLLEVLTKNYGSSVAVKMEELFMGRKKALEVSHEGN